MGGGATGAAARFLLVGILAYWTLLFAVQRNLLFPRPPAGGWPERPADAESLWLTTPSGAVEAWFVPPTASGGGSAPLVIYHHGNGEVIDLWPRAFGALRERGVAVLLVEYPGYGRSAGAPSERSLTETVCAAYDRMVRRPGINPERIVAYGRSVGGGAACALAARRPLAALILESSFTSVRDLTHRYAAPGFLARDPFDNRSVVRRFAGPVLVLHGSKDRVIPAAHGRRLAAAAPRAELHLRPCGHDDCPPPWDLVLEFLAVHGIVPRWAGDGG